MAKVKKYLVTRKIAETYYCEAETKEEAKKLVSFRGNPVTVIVLSETVKPVR